MPLAVSMFFIAMLAIMEALYLPARDAQMTQATANVHATSALAYRESVINYLNVNPSFVGTVPDALLTFAWGYRRDARWSHVIDANTLFVYEAQPSVNSIVIDSLYSQTMKSYMVGRNVSGRIVSANGFATGVSVPSGIPEGSLLIAGK